MAVGHRLPNGYVVILLTPREATLHRDQILAPEDYPWTNPSESQMVAMEIRSICERAVIEDSLQRLGEASNELIKVVEQKAEMEKLKKKGYWQCPDCEYVNSREHESCQSCSLDKPAEEGVEVDE